MYNNKHHTFEYQYNHKLFAHCNRWGPDVFAYLESARPKIVKFLDANVDAVERARDLLPDALLIYRRYTPIQNLGNNQAEAEQLGRDFAAQVAAQEAVSRGYVNLVESYNEILGETANTLLHRRYDRFQVAFYEALQGVPTEPIAFNFGTGNMSGSQVLDLYPATLATYKWLGFHEYDWPTMDRLHKVGLAEGNGGMWLALRYRRIMSEIIAAQPGRAWSVVITECGMTQIIHEGAQDVGYAHPENTVPGALGSHPTPISPADYWSTLQWYNSELMKDDYVAGACIFVTGGTSDWQSFEAIPQVTNLIQQQQVVITEPPPNGDPPMANEPFVVDVRPDDDPDLAVVPRITTFEQLKQFWPIEVDRRFGEDGVADGQQYWRLIGFEVKGGAATLQPQVKQLDGSEADKILVLFHWPDADALHPDVSPRYKERAVAGFTDGGGSVGIGLGQAALVYWVWCSADPPGLARRGSDGVGGLGWMGNTNHVIANPIFQATVKGGATTPPPGNGGTVGDTLDIELRIGGQTVFRQQYQVTLTPVG